MYQRKSIFPGPWPPPAAEPMMRMEPPCPRSKAMNSHKKLSAGVLLRSYMPMLAATSGTLSTTALTRPDDHHNHVLATHCTVQPLCNAGKDVRVLQYRHRGEECQ